MPQTTIRTLIKDATQSIKKSPAIDHWQDGREQDDAEVLLGHVLEMDSEDFDFLAPVSAADARKFQTLVKRRVKGEPVALITGEFYFRDLHLLTRPGVFIPRYSSEFVIDLARDFLKRRKQPVVVDLCTGAGAVPLALANELKGSKTYGVDIARDAVELSRDNARRLGIKNAKFLLGDLLQPIPKALRGKVTLFTMHPPYVARDEVADLPDEIRRWEPKHTLTDNSPDGLGFVRDLALEGPEWLAPRGKAMVEIGPHLARKAVTIFKRAGWRDVSSEKDDVGATRVIVATRP